MGNNSSMSPTTDHISFIALGSNISHEKLTKGQLVAEAIGALREAGFAIRARSRDFTSPAFPAGSGPDFINAVVEVEAPFGAEQTLAALHEIEAAFGRSRDVRWGPRTLDLDLLACGETVLPNAKIHQYWRELPLETQVTTAPQEPIVPHPRLAERAFVLVPMMDIAPDWVHPVTGQTVRAMHDALPLAARCEVVAL